MQKSASPWRLVAPGCVAALAAAGCGSRSGLDRSGLDRSGLDDLERLSESAELAVAPPASVEPAPEREGCVDITRRYTSEPATVLLLIDQSQSMSFRFGESTRWEVLRQAIVDPEQGLLASLDPSARVGLMLYTGRDGFDNPLGCPLLTRVEAEFDNVDAVRSAYLSAGPTLGGDTPTGESISEAALALGAIPSAAPKYILLATDGQPDTCAQPKPSEGLPLALEAASRAFASGIRVYVLGVSSGLDAWRLQQLANAGAGKDPSLVYSVDADAEPPLSASNDPRELAAQLRGIVGDARSCTVELGTTVGSDRALEGRLVLDGRVLDNDTENGWTFVDGGTLRLNGAACDRVLDDGERLEVRFPCEDERARIR